jgi:hypothetical protein
MAIIYSYPQISTVDMSDLLIITDISKTQNPTRNVTVQQLANTISVAAYPNRYLMNGLVNNIASTVAGYDFMEWVSNTTPDTQIPLMRTGTQPLELESIMWAWCGDAALSIGVGEQVAFSIGSIPDGVNSQIGNFVAINTLFNLTNADDGTFPSGELIFPAGTIQISKHTNMGVVGLETGSVTPNDGELAITLQFKSI